MKILKIILTIAFICIRFAGNAQENKLYPIVGQPMPEFMLKDVHHYSSKTFSNKDLKGKWTIIDFWSKGCSSCVQSFPKVNQLQTEFKDQVQFLLVGKNDFTYNSNIDVAYEKYRKKLGLNLPIAYDSTIFEQFGIHSVPHVIVVDPYSYVYAVTDSYFLIHDKLQSLVDGNKPDFRKKYNTHEHVLASAYHDPWKYLVNENEKERDFLYRSIFSENTGEPYAGSLNIDENTKQGFYQKTRFTLFQAYNIAYLGESDWIWNQSLYKNYWAQPILDLQDSSYFQFNYLENKGLYNYSLIVPEKNATKEYLMKLMQKDLKNYFGYDVFFETREMPYWSLTATDKAREKLASKSEVVVDNREPTGILFKKMPIAMLLLHIMEYNEDEKIPFIDETNIKTPIDISYSALMTNINDVADVLKKQGLILKKSKKKMKVLVIRDSLGESLDQANPNTTKQ